MFVKQLLSTVLFLAVLIAGAFGPHPAASPESEPAIGRGRLIDVAPSPTATHLAFTLTSGILVVEAETMSRTAYWSLPRARALAWSPAGELLLALDGQGELHAFGSAGGSRTWSTPSAADDVADWRFRPDLGLLALETRADGLRVFRLCDGAPVDDPGLTSAAFWADGQP